VDVCVDVCVCVCVCVKVFSRAAKEHSFLKLAFYKFKHRHAYTLVTLVIFCIILHILQSIKFLYYLYNEKSSLTFWSVRNTALKHTIPIRWPHLRMTFNLICKKNENNINLKICFLPRWLSIRFRSHFLSKNLFRFSIRILRNEIGLGNKSNAGSSLVTHRTFLVKNIIFFFPHAFLCWAKTILLDI